MFLPAYKAMLNYHLGTRTLVQHKLAYILHPLRTEPRTEQILTRLTALTLLGSLQHLLQLLLGSVFKSFCLMLHSANVLYIKVVKVSTRQWFLALMVPMALPV